MTPRNTPRRVAADELLEQRIVHAYASLDSMAGHPRVNRDAALMDYWKLCGLIEAHMVIRTAQLSSEALRTRMGRYADTELGIDLAGLKTRIDLEGQ